MSVRLVKYCPLCGAANDPAEPFCAACKDGEMLAIAPQPLQSAVAPAAPAAAAPAVRAAVSAIDWEAEPGAAPAPTPQAPDTVHVDGEDATATVVLELVERPTLRFDVADGQTIGASRDAARPADVTLTGVPELEYISSVHARLFRRGEQWYVQHLGCTNFLRVDGMKYDKREEVPLHDGTVLVLSKTAFRVCLGGGG
jgi:hypothetical protein